MQKKSVNEIVITVVLILVLLFIVIGNLKKHKNVKPALNKIESSVGRNSSEGEKKNTGGLFLKLEEETKKLELKRDPFFPGPVITRKESPHGLYLSGIVWEKQKPSAIINGKILGIGGTLGTNTVIDIKEDKVILYDGSGNNIELELNQ